MVETIVPTEEIEQRLVVQFCRFKGYPLFHVPNSTFTKSWQIKKRNTELGVAAGVPDLFVIVNGQLIAIEMKRKTGGKLSPAQKEWLERLNEAGIPAQVCRGANEAIGFINFWHKGGGK